MTAKAEESHTARPPIPMNWTNVREVYRKLQTDFHLLTAPFGIFVSDERNEDLSQLIGAIDVVDRELDRLDVASQRETFISEVLKYLRGDSSDLTVVASRELHDRMEILREAIIRLGIRSEFVETVRQVVDHGEAKRLAKTDDEMIEHLVEEWRLTGVLPVLFLGEFSNPAFEKFFYLCCATMPAIDMLQDARMDYRSGQINIRPTIRLHFKLLKVFCRPLPKLLFLFPAPLTLIRYAMSFVWQGLSTPTALQA